MDLLDRRQKLKCWRDPKLVKRLTGFRLRVVSSKMREARRVLSKELRIIASTSSKTETGRKWQEVRDVQKEVWEAENPKHQQKVGHMVWRLLQCGSHKVCRIIDKLAGDKWRGAVKSQEHQVDDILSSENKEDGWPVSGDPGPGQSDDPDSLLSWRYFSRPRGPGEAQPRRSPR